MNGEICLQMFPGTNNPTDTSFSQAPSVCLNSQPGNQEILSTRAGEEPVEISWSHPLVLQIIIIMITPDGGNSQRAFTSGLPPCVPEPLGLAELVWQLFPSPLCG